MFLVLTLNLLISAVFAPTAMVLYASMGSIFAVDASGNMPKTLAFRRWVSLTYYFQTEFKYFIGFRHKADKSMNAFISFQ